MSIWNKIKNSISNKYQGVVLSREKNIMLPAHHELIEYDRAFLLDRALLKKGKDIVNISVDQGQLKPIPAEILEMQEWLDKSDEDVLIMKNVSKGEIKDMVANQIMRKEAIDFLGRFRSMSVSIESKQDALRRIRDRKDSLTEADVLYFEAIGLWKCIAETRADKFSEFSNRINWKTVSEKMIETEAEKLENQGEPEMVGPGAAHIRDMEAKNAIDIPKFYSIIPYVHSNSVHKGKGGCLLKVHAQSEAAINTFEFQEWGKAMAQFYYAVGENANTLEIMKEFPEAKEAWNKIEKLLKEKVGVEKCLFLLS